MRRMSKTSIFSSKYEKRQRRKRFFRNLLFLIVLLAALILIFRKPIMEMIEKVKQDIAQEEVQKEEILEQLPETVINEEAETPVEEEPVAEKVYVTAVLPGSEAVSLEILEENGIKTFSPDLELNGMESDLSPAGNQAVILDSKTQDLFLVDINGNVKDITYKVYTKKDKTYSATKEQILAKYNGEFVWGEQPRFLDEDTVVYMSQLPWFDERRFLYIVELNPLSYKNFQSVFGTDVVLKDSTEKGLAYEKEGKTYYLTPDYKIVQE